MASRMVIFFAVIFLTACSGRPREKKAEPPKAAEVTDFPLSFNGRSIKGWEVTNFGPQGPVYVSGNDIILGMGDGCTGINWKGEFPKTNYEISLEAKRVEGNDFFCGITFPAGKDPCTLIIGGWGGTTVGLSSIEGMDAAENETTSLMSFEKNTWYKIRLRVTDSFIEAFVDSTRVVDFKYTGRRISIRPEVELSKPFGIASWRTTAAVRKIEVTTVFVQ
jgi:hypothetical protein